MMNSFNKNGIFHNPYQLWQISVMVKYFLELLRMKFLDNNFSKHE